MTGRKKAQPDNCRVSRVYRYVTAGSSRRSPPDASGRLRSRPGSTTPQGGYPRNCQTRWLSGPPHGRRRRLPTRRRPITTAPAPRRAGNSPGVRDRRSVADAEFVSQSASECGRRTEGTAEPLTICGRSLSPVSVASTIRKVASTLLWALVGSLPQPLRWFRIFPYR